MKLEWEKEKERKKTNEFFSVYYNWQLEVQIAAYHHRRNHRGFLTTVGTSLARTGRKRWTAELGLFGGGLMRYYDETVYIVEDERVNIVNHAARISPILGFRTAVLRSFSPQSPLFWYFGGQTAFDLSFSTSFTLLQTLEVGLIYQFQ